MTMSSNLTPFSPVLGVAAVVDDGSFLRAHGLASSKVHRTEERNKIVLLNLVYERKKSEIFHQTIINIYIEQIMSIYSMAIIKFVTSFESKQ